MGRLILDSSVLISAERGGADPARFVSVEDDVAIAAITVAELLHGVERADRRHRAARRQWVERVVDTLPVEEYDQVTARAHAQLLAVNGRTGRTHGAHDLIIAATALTRQRTLLTTDKGFGQLPGVEVRLVA